MKPKHVNEVSKGNLIVNSMSFSRFWIERVTLHQKSALPPVYAYAGVVILVSENLVSVANSPIHNFSYAIPALIGQSLTRQQSFLMSIKTRMCGFLDSVLACMQGWEQKILAILNFFNEYFSSLFIIPSSSNQNGGYTEFSINTELLPPLCM